MVGLLEVSTAVLKADGRAALWVEKTAVEKAAMRVYKLAFLKVAPTEAWSAV